MAHRWARVFVVLSVLLVLNGTSTAANQGEMAPLGTGFTYQGRLEDNGIPADGTFDFRFILYDAATGASQLGETLVRGDVTVTDGYFSVTLDFGATYNDQAWWLEVGVRPGSSTGAYTVLSPRQPLTAAPFAHYARGAPWSGLSGVPAGFADGVDNNTTYTAGAGLSLSGGAFSVNYAGSGVATTAARSDHTHTVLSHTHLGQTWTGSSNPLVINGAFSGTDNAPLVLSNTAGHGLLVTSADGDGLRIVRADNYGVVIQSSGEYGLFIGSAPAGIWVRSVINGVIVDNADDDGVVIKQAGSPGASVGDNQPNGVEVRGSSGSGVFVGWTGNDGIHVRQAGSPSTVTPSTLNNGVEVEGAEGYGVYVGRSNATGFVINSAGNNGMSIGSASSNGVWANSVGNDGFYVGSAGQDGIEATGTQYAGYFHGNINVTGSVLASRQGYFAVNTGVRALEPGEFVVVRGVRQEADQGAPLALEVEPLTEGGTVIGVVQARAERVMEEHPGEGEGKNGKREPKLVPGEGVAEPGDFLVVITYGVVQARVSPESSTLKAGDRLVVSAMGQVRGLKTVEVDGVQVAENAPIVGIALDEPGDDGLVWVLISPQ